MLTIAIITAQSANATRVSGYFDQGAIYSGSSVQDLSTLKKGVASANNILFLFETGDASINTAAKNGGIKKISHVDIQEKSVFILWYGIKVFVYGE